MTGAPEQATAAAAPTGGAAGRRAYLPVVALLACAAIAAALGSATWLRARIEPTGAMTVLHDTVSGASANPAGVAFALVALVAPVVFVATGKRMRQIAAVLALLAGIGVIVTSLRVAADPQHAAQHSSKLADTQVTDVQSSVWPYLQAIAGLGIVVSSAAALRAAPTWRTMSRKYDAPSGARPPADEWEALERGVDPTSDA